jgi:anti-sigma factor RsiW
VSAFVEGDLEPAEAGRIAEHIAGCTRCREAAADLRMLVAGARELALVEPPARVWERIRERTAARPRSARRWLWFGVPTLAAAAAVAGFVVGPRIAPVSRMVQAVLRPQPAATEAAMARETKQDYAEYVHGIDAAIADCEDALKENPANARVRAAYAGARSSRATAYDRLVSGGE